MARLFGFAEQTGVVDGDRSAPCQVLGRPELGLLVAPAALGRDERDRPERAVPGHERNAHRRLQSELLEDVVELRCLRGRLEQQLGWNVREQLRLSRTNDVRDSVLRLRVRGIPLGQVVRPANLLGVDVRDREPFDRPILCNHVDRAPVCELRHRERREVRERGLVVERRCEELARPRDEALIFRETALRLVELGGPDCRRGEICEQRCSALLRLAERAWLSVVDDEGPDDPFAVTQRQRHHRAGALGGVSAAVVRVQPLRLLDVLGDDGPVERHGRRVVADRLHRRGDVLVRQPVASADAPDPGRLVDLPDRVGVGGKRPAGKGEHLRQHRLDVERAEERGGRLEQESQPSELLGVAPFGVV